MKKLFLLFISFIPIVCLSQDSDTSYLENVKWEVFYRCYDAGYPFSANNIFESREDTLISGNTYTTIYAGSDNNPSFALREENQKIFFVNFRNPNENTEHLVFDFSLEENDVFTYSDIIDIYVDTVNVLKVDSIELLDETKRKRIELSEEFFNICGETSHWIEGIGSVPTPFYFLDCFECSVKGYKFYKDGILLFEDGETTVSVDEISAIQFQIEKHENYLNIVTDQSVRSVSIYGLNGQLHSQSLQSNRVDTSRLLRGIYIVEVVYKNDNRQSAKFFN